jgi:sulfide dehydrogenase [flavocytochrome c] flavoprotein chain
MRRIDRRDFIKAGAAGLALAGMAGCASLPGAGARARVAVVGGGYGGATAARYIRMLDPSIEVVLIEPNEAFVSCPISNMVLAGFRQMSDITVSYSGLERHGVKVVRDMATAIDMEKKQVRLARGEPVGFDRVVVSPGIDFMWEALPAMGSADAQARVLHAWKAGPQTAQLRQQLVAMRDGGVYVLTVPLAPYRCPPGPYERVSQIAAYFKAAKPRSKIILLDENANITSKGPLFRKAWADLYPGMIEYRGASKVLDVDVRSGTIKGEFGDQRGDVLNVLPPMKAGNIAAPYITANRRWCEVDWLTFESKAVKGVHVLGDSLQLAPLMPKSATMANGHGKVCAAAIVAMLNGQAPSGAPIAHEHLLQHGLRPARHPRASVHKYDQNSRTFRTVPGAGGVSAAMNESEGLYTMNWARNIWADTLM